MIDIFTCYSTINLIKSYKTIDEKGRIMEQNRIDGFRELERNLEATIHEGTIKLGFVKGEYIGIYYDYELLVHLLKQTPQEKKELMPILQEFAEYVKGELGLVQVTMEKSRYKVTVSPEGVAHIVEKNKENGFLKELIEEMSKSDCNVSSIKDIFYKYSNDVICEKSDNEEFDYVIQFKDKEIDPFIYCFTFDVMGKYYHRLTDFDFHRL